MFTFLVRDLEESELSWDFFSNKLTQYWQWVYAEEVNTAL